MGMHPETRLEEALRRAQALALAATAEIERLQLRDTWAAAELLDLLETTLTDAQLALGLAVKTAAKRAA